MTDLYVSQWTKDGPVVTERHLEGDESGFQSEWVYNHVHGSKTQKPTKSKQADYDLVEHETGLYVALKSGHAYLVKSGEAEIETEVLGTHTLVPAPGPAEAEITVLPLVPTEK